MVNYYLQLQQQIEKIEALRFTETWGPEFQLWLQKTGTLVGELFGDAGLKLFNQQRTTTTSYIDDLFNLKQYLKELNNRKTILEGLLADAGYEEYRVTAYVYPVASKEESIAEIKNAITEVESLSEFLKEDLLKSEKYYKAKYRLEDALSLSKTFVSEIAQARIEKAVPSLRLDPRSGVLVVTQQVQLELVPLVRVAHMTLKELEGEKSVSLPKHFSAGEGYDARVAFRQILKTLKDKIDLVDNFLHPDTLELIIDVAKEKQQTVTIRLITSLNNKRLAILGTDVDKIKSQHSNIIVNLISTKDVHDRYMVLNGKVYHSGHSFHQLGDKASRLDEETNLVQQQKIISDIEGWISNGKIEK